ncbi:MAG: DUF2027 domain-containing protein [Bacteroidales bacterium]|nr:DUF2027 domain-containing protein [Bacteroidales bacterium]
MKIKAGDQVKFLNDVGGGKVTKIIDKETALILNDTGFEVPVLIEELMLEITDDVRRSISESVIPEKEINVFEEEPIYTDSNEVNFYLAFVPENQKRIGDTDCEVYLINDSNYFVYYNYAVKKGEKYTSITGKLEPNVKEKISVFELNSLQDTINIVMQLIFFDKEEYSLKEPVSSRIKLKATRFFKQNSFKENDFFDEFAIITSVTEENSMQEAVEKLKKEDIDAVVKQKDGKRPRIQQNKENKSIKEVDLHIHELIDDESGMSDYDKLQLQLDAFHKELQTAIKENYRRIVFIHGVGSGSLKLKIRSELQHKYKKYQFQDASFKEYGYGATMILLRK